MKGKYKICLGIIAVLIIVTVLVLVFYKKDDNKPTGEEIKEPEIQVVENIDKYGYSLDERDSIVMKSTYEELKNLLNSSEIDYEAYAKTLAKLFVIDLWTMNNKTNRYDVGSIEYVYPDNVENFKLNVENTIYKQIENNVNGSRKQTLPAVKSIVSADLNKEKIELKGQEIDSYIVSLEWDYEENLGYDTKASITLINENDKLYVVEYVAGE